MIETPSRIEPGCEVIEVGCGFLKLRPCIEALEFRERPGRAVDLLLGVELMNVLLGGILWIQSDRSHSA